MGSEMCIRDSNIYINVGSLIEYVTSGSKVGDQIVIDVSADHIMNLGIEQGKRVGEILNSLLDEVISGALENEHNALMQRAVELLG